MIRLAIAGVAAATVLLACAVSAQAADAFFSGNGSGSTCTLAAPCQLSEALNFTSGGNEIACADSTNNFGVVITKSITIDCSGTGGSIQGINVNAAGIIVVLKNVEMYNTINNAILNAGTLIMDNVHVTECGTAVLAQPSVASTLVVKNSLFDNCQQGVQLIPNSGGSLSAQFDHVVITNIAGGGIKTSSANGSVTVDITDSVIRSNSGNGINAVAGSSESVVSIKNSVIANNGAAGVQANGGNAGVLIQTTLMDLNAAGATSLVGGGHITTYGNNTIVGSSGSGFNGNAPLQ
jgi:hypothetical protein